MKQDHWIESWKQEEARPFAGWDFSYVEGRMLEDEPPWDYLGRAAELMARSSSLLDLGTGGGERLLELRAHWPERVVVTEGYAPNVALAAERLGPLGVKVINLESSKYVPLPFDDGEFDLVLNRHSGVNSPEVARVLAPGGTYLTQQVHGLSGHDLIALFGAELQWPDATSERYVRRLEEAGLAVVTVEDWSGTTSFADVEAVVFYLKAIPWVVPGFSVATHLETLLELQRRLEAGEALTFSSRRYLVEARKPFDTEGAIQSPTG